MTATEFPRGSRWRSRRARWYTVLVCGEAGGLVAYRRFRKLHVKPAEQFRETFERVPHPEGP